MKDTKEFIKAYHDFRESVDFTKSGFLPDVDDLVCHMLMGIPRVPADKDPDETAPVVAIDQRAAILKAVFVEVNRNQPKDFLDKGMVRYDQAGKLAKILLQESTE